MGQTSEPGVKISNLRTEYNYKQAHDATGTDNSNRKGSKGSLLLAIELLYFFTVRATQQ